MVQETQPAQAPPDAAPQPATNGQRPPVQRRLVPPVGFPLAPDEVSRAVRGVFFEARVRRKARRALCDFLGVRRAWCLNSGRAALTLALRTLAGRYPERREVVLPAYTCYSVPAAVVRAGLTVRLVDLVPGSFDVDLEELEGVLSERTLAVVAPHLLGFPMDLGALRERTQKAGAFLIDDAAQGLGARRQARPSGGGGDVGVLSFGRGKPVTTLGGGALVCDDPELVQLFEPVMAGLERPARLASCRTAVEAALYGFLLRPEVYWLPSRLPFLKVGHTEFDPEFPIRSLASIKYGLLVQGFKRLDLVSEARRRIAERLIAGFKGVQELELFEKPAEGYATYLRFPMLCRDREARDASADALRRAGVAAGPLYPDALNRIAPLRGVSPDAGQSYPAAEALAERLLVLPTYPHVSPAVRARIVRTLGGDPTTQVGHEAA